jgi:hypothetical protein
MTFSEDAKVHVVAVSANGERRCLDRHEKLFRHLNGMLGRRASAFSIHIIEFFVD